MILKELYQGKMNNEKILSILSDTLNKDISDIKNYPTDSLLKELGLDSINFVKFIVAFEEEFNIETYDSDLLLTKFETINLIFDTLKKYFYYKSIKKVLICDCDNVLWHGIFGEEEIFIDDKIISFQKDIIQLNNTGVLVCLCSKNEQINIDDIFEQLDMPLKSEYIAISKTNFRDKATNIKLIADKLNLSLDSFVFIDDSDYELGLINALIPEVTTIKVDYNNLYFIQEIKDRFNIPNTDINRTKLYKEQKEREKEKLHFNSVEEYNNSLKTEIICLIASSDQAERISELSQRTNQFNLSGKRYSVDEIINFINDKNYNVISISIKDKYGDMGIVGASIIKITESTALIDSFYISCRVFGRCCEYALLEIIKNMYTHKKIFGTYIRTEKNQKYADFFKNNGVNYHAE